MEALVLIIVFFPLVVAALVIIASPFILAREWKKIRRGPAPDVDANAEREPRTPRGPADGSSDDPSIGRSNGHLPANDRRR